MNIFSGLSAYTPDQFRMYHNSASLGMDVETGGQVFQLFVTNSFPVNEVQLIPYITGKWSKGRIRPGFNISGAFSMNKVKILLS